MGREEVPEDVALEEYEEEALEQDESAGEYGGKRSGTDFTFEVPEADALEQRVTVPDSDEDYR